MVIKAVFANFVVIEQEGDWNVRMLVFRSAGARASLASPVRSHLIEKRRTVLQEKTHLEAE